MENATKALLIAAGVLVVILIITFGVGIFQMGEEATSGLNLSQQEVQAFNQQFDQYHGTAKRGNEVNAMLKTVIQSNIKVETEGNADTRTVTVDGEVTVGAGDTSVPTGVIDTSKLYDITVTYNGETGLVNEITVAEH